MCKKFNVSGLRIRTIQEAPVDPTEATAIADGEQHRQTSGLYAGLRVKTLVPAVVKQAAEKTEAPKVEATPAMPATPKVEAPPATM